MHYYSLPSAEFLKTLDACVYIEECCARIYRHYESMFSDNPDIATLWKEMAADEDIHADKFRHAILTYGCNPGCENEDNYLVEAIVGQLNSYIENIRNNPPQLQEAFITAAILEHSIEKYHVATCSLLINAELKVLLSEMAHSDRCHRMMLEKLNMHYFIGH